MLSVCAATASALVGIVFAAGLLANAAIRYPAGWAADRWGTRPVILGAMGAYLHPMTPAEVTAFAEEQQRTWRPVAEQVAKEAAEPSK